MRKGNDTVMSDSQAKRVEWLRTEGALVDAPAAEVKVSAVYQPEPGDPLAPGRLARHVIVHVVIGFPDDHLDYRAALRTTRIYIVSPRGRYEEWTPRRGFALGAQTHTDSVRPEADATA